jgi:hypothetical protein
MNIKVNEFRGINQSKDRQLTDIEFAVRAENCSIKKGVLERAAGFSPYNNFTTAADIKRLMVFYSTTGPVLLAGCADNKLYKLTAAGWVSIGTFTNTDFNYINYQKDLDRVILLTNGVDNVKVWDGTTLRDVKLDPTAGATLSDGSANIAPKGKYITLHRERVWITGGDKDTLYYSDDMNFDDWTTPTDEVEVNEHGGFVMVPTWDGGEILGLRGRILGDLVIYKSQNVFRVFGTYPGNYEIVEIFNTLDGYIVEKTIASSNTQTFWLTTKGIHMYTGDGYQDLTPNVQDYFNEINQGAINGARAAMYQSQYIIAVSWKESAKNNLILIFDTITGQWMVRTGIEVADFLEVDEKLLFAGYDGKLYIYNTGETYNGQPINAFYETGTIYADDSTIELDEMNMAASGETYVKVSCITEKRTKSVNIPVDNVDKAKNKTITASGKLISFRFENVDGGKMVIKQPQFLGEADPD